MKTPFVQRDERTTSVENESYRWAYLLLSFGLLASVAYRSFLLQESSWDLLALVLLGGLITTFYQASHRILSGRWAMLSLLTVLISGGIAVAWVLLR